MNIFSTIASRRLASVPAADDSRRRFIATAVAAAALVVAASARNAFAAPAVHTVVIDGFAFKPAQLTVKLGDTVVWRNNDPVPHTATAKGVFDSGSIAAGGTWKHVTTKRGRHDYVCSFHPNMKGTLIVE